MNYYKILEHLEELSDIRLYDKVKESNQEYVNAGEAFRKIEENRLGVV